jgi:hypothetical protein
MLKANCDLFPHHMNLQVIDDDEQIDKIMNLFSLVLTNSIQSIAVSTNLLVFSKHINELT